MSRTQVAQKIPPAAFSLMAVGATCLYEGLLTDFFRFAGMETLPQRKDFIHTVVNDGIKKLPYNQRQQLLGWSRKMLESEPESRKAIARRQFIKVLPVAAIGTTLAGFAVKDVLQDKETRAEIEGLALVYGAGNAAIMKMIHNECEALFKDKLVSWLKQEYKIDLLPALQKRAAQQRGAVSASL